MLYTSKNTVGAVVVDVDTKERSKRVMEVSTKGAWMKVGYHPVRFDAQGRVMGERIRFRSVHAIHGLESQPCLFHCYGRLPAGAA